MKTRWDIPLVLAITVSLVLWASAFAGIRAGLDAYSPGHLALLRFLVASVALAAYGLATRMRLPRWHDWPGIALAGFCGFTVYHLALSVGEVTVSAGAASLLVSTSPIFTALLATAFLGERLRGWGWGGVLVSFAGATVIALGEAAASGRGLSFSPHALLVLLAAVGSSGYFILQKPYLQRYSALEFTAAATWAGTLFMLPLAAGLPQAVLAAPPSITLVVVYLGVFPAAIAYVVWGYFIARIPASRATSFLQLSPVLSIAVAWLWLRETPHLLSLLGGAVAILGVVMVNKRQA